MRIAFDCLGTLMGSHGPALAEAIPKLQALGHECVIWSSLYSYTIEMKNKYKLNVETMEKRSTYEMREYEMELFDVAVDDDRGQTYLGAKAFVYVDEITKNSDAIVAFILKRATETKGETDELI